MTNKKTFLDCLCDFLGSSDGMTTEQVRLELEKGGIDTKQLTERTEKIIKAYAKHRDDQ